jgi:hypothetical protein
MDDAMAVMRMKLMIMMNECNEAVGRAKAELR